MTFCVRLSTLIAPFLIVAMPRTHLRRVGDGSVPALTGHLREVPDLIRCPFFTFDRPRSSGRSPVRLRPHRTMRIDPGAIGTNSGAIGIEPGTRIAYILRVGAGVRTCESHLGQLPHVRRQPKRVSEQRELSWEQPEWVQGQSPPGLGQREPLRGQLFPGCERGSRAGAIGIGPGTNAPGLGTVGTDTGTIDPKSGTTRPAPGTVFPSSIPVGKYIVPFQADSVPSWREPLRSCSTSTQCHPLPVSVCDEPRMTAGTSIHIATRSGSKVKSDRRVRTLPAMIGPDTVRFGGVQLRSGRIRFNSSFKREISL